MQLTSERLMAREALRCAMRAVRVVGRAMGRNPCSILLPNEGDECVTMSWLIRHCGSVNAAKTEVFLLGGFVDEFGLIWSETDALEMV